MNGLQSRPTFTRGQSGGQRLHEDSAQTRGIMPATAHWWTGGLRRVHSGPSASWVLYSEPHITLECIFKLINILGHVQNSVFLQ